mgnify:CR=1 FL=1
MNFLRAELKKILSMTEYCEEAVYVGNCGYVRVNEDVRNAPGVLQIFYWNI